MYEKGKEIQDPPGPSLTLYVLLPAENHIMRQAQAPLERNAMETSSKSAFLSARRAHRTFVCLLLHCIEAYCIKGGEGSLI